MAFDDFLNHTCTITIPGKAPSGDVDDWGRPILVDKEPFKSVPCRYIRKGRNVVNANGSARVYETSILLSPTQKVSPDMTVSDVKDSLGIVLSEVTFTTQEILPRNSKNSLHNLKVILKGGK